MELNMNNLQRSASRAGPSSTGMSVACFSLWKNAIKDRVGTEIVTRFVTVEWVHYSIHASSLLPSQCRLVHKITKHNLCFCKAQVFAYCTAYTSSGRIESSTFIFFTFILLQSGVAPHTTRPIPLISSSTGLQRVLQSPLLLFFYCWGTTRDQWSPPSTESKKYLSMFATRNRCERCKHVRGNSFEQWMNTKGKRFMHCWCFIEFHFHFMYFTIEIKNSRKATAMR